MKNLLRIALILAFTSKADAATIYRVYDYVSATQSPFYEGIQNGSMFFNNFELGTGLGPNLTIPQATTFTNYSIDGDDGVVDGFTHGFGLRSRGTNSPPFVFNFTPDASGHYPRYFGLAFPTAIGPTTWPSWFVPETENQRRGYFEILGVKDAFSNPVLTNYVFDTSMNNLNWGTFMGIYNEDGISQITLQNAYWIDHLQYGYSIPEPTTATFGVLALVSWCGRRRRAPLT